MEHATPAQFWVDKSSCRYTDENGQVKNPALADCAESITIAQQQGKKIYTINQSNAATALPRLPVGGDVGAEIRSAVNAGKEVTFHESQITAHGWTRYGYIITAPETGVGAFLIEGKGSGGWLSFEDVKNLIFIMLGAIADAMAIAIATKDFIKGIIDLMFDGYSGATVFLRHY